MNVSKLCLLILAQSKHNIKTPVCVSSLLTYCHMTGVGVILWVLGGSKYDCSIGTYISKNICLCYYFGTSFHEMWAY